ncbi:MAG: acetolactate synthase large subunit [Gammaproteobacteria bacterium CG11_big_fil_rev_8_21_14_0_20_46_22]|nr:MAG: acetolactate synthase large subunit [Gammaproteobacteria bacterium CG12_big_fil_rev_8_21_14_0_65_46_12]PIR11517.1 MAG: acetolactate synthase large subunit [Gammaproteobacteria bacterium CG11_big_fil_rev_8_21_14_0_20_46_22]
MKASDLLLRCLEAEGVEAIYGVPGEENADIMISLLNSPIKFITCRHEQTASFMADMHGRLTGKPGVCLATLGPGATNLITGVANANMDRVPLIALIGQAETTRLHKESHQNMDSVAMYREVTKWSTTIREADVIPEVVRKAFKVATEEKPGAVLIELPEDVAKEDTDKQVIIPREKTVRGVETFKAKKALELIEKAKKPLLLVGFGCVREECDKELLQFIEETGIYAADTFMGKGAVPASHAQSLHCVGLGMKDIAVEAFDEADLIICAGYDLVEWAPSRWNPNNDKTIIHIDTVPAEVDEAYVPELELIGDVKEIFRLLNQHLGRAHKKDLGVFAKIRARILADLESLYTDQSIPMKPQRILHDLRELMTGDDILISDVGAHKMWVARQYETYRSKTCFIYNGFCSMGGSMPGALLAKQLRSKQNVVALCGDGGFMMSIQALATAVRFKVPMVVLVWEDHHYGLIQWKQEAAYHQESHVALDNPDLKALSESFGAHAERVEKPEDLKQVLQEAFARHDKPSVIVVPVDYSENMKLTERLGEIVSSG